MQLLLIALATLASEDLTCIATGVLIAQGQLGFVEGTAACLAGIFAGDMLLFLAGRIAGARALRWPPMARFLTPERVARGAEWLSRRGLVVVFLSRFTPGFRLPTYFAAGLLPTRMAAFAGFFLLASALWTPLIVGASAVFGEELLVALFARQYQGLAAFGVVFAVLIVAARLVRPLLDPSGRRRLAGFLKRKVQWEFWPAWAAYLPLAPYFIYLVIRHRSTTLFTSANPGIFSGGFVGESKSEILRHLSRVEDAVAEFDVIPASLDPAHRLAQAMRFMADAGLAYPIVLKPDVGQRGAGVAVVRSPAELEAYLRGATGDTIVQRHVAGEEFGVFYYRYPHESRGRISSITHKRFPAVAGDGRRTLGELILDDPRAVCMSAAYERVARRPLDSVPAAGERVQLVELGSHCRGAVFADARGLNTPALEEAVERVSRAHPGFFFGRFDVRSPSIEGFREGRFLVLELNGVSGEAAHVYDPAVSIVEAYRTMARQWRIAFEIGSANRALGAQPMRLADFIALIAGGGAARPAAMPEPVGETR
jgi:membrane protein DedA with SNARE-associated domain